jgi:RNA polymerase sigma-70 factor (ECF subfamily)
MAGASATAYIMRIAERQDRTAFAALFTEFAPKVKAFAIRRGAAAPDEVTQEVMLAVWRKAASYDPARGAGEAWIFAVARNACIDAARRDRGQPLLELEPPDTPEAPRGDRQLEAAEDVRRVRAAVASLSPEQSEVVRLSFFDDRPHAEISARLGLPLGTVKSRLRLAMKRLRELLDDPR